tara:strand:- start:2188 stop:2775 length:588 start_codon:yes stop_codon:yes gene_type:complete
MKIWYENIRYFLQIENLFDFIPSSSMNDVDKLNAIFKLSIYIGILMFLFTNKSNSLIIPIMVGIVTYVIHDIVGHSEEFEIKKKKKLESVCRNSTKPTKQNPFMNVLMNEYVENPTRSKACDVSKVNAYVDKYFDENTVSTADNSTFDTTNSRRQFVTMPNTSIPTNQDELLKFFYPMPEKTCKEGNTKECKYFS